MARINVYNYPGPFDYDTERTLAGWFDYKKAEEWSDMDYNGNGSHGTGAGQAVLRTAKGRWVLENWTRWEGRENTYEFISDETAKDWLLRNDCDSAVTQYFGEIEEEVDLGGRPEIGPASTIRIGVELTDLADKRAAEDGISRAELIRRAVRAYVA